MLLTVCIISSRFRIVAVIHLAVNIRCTKNKIFRLINGSGHWLTTFSVTGYTKNPLQRRLPFFCAAKIKYYLPVILSPKLVIIYGRKINLTNGNNEQSLLGPGNINPAVIAVLRNKKLLGAGMKYG
jgi:hypothetical protein